MDTFSYKKESGTKNIVHTETINGRRIVITFTEQNPYSSTPRLSKDYFCGYVEVTPDEYNADIYTESSTIECHGDITYQGIVDDVMYIGFDCHGIGDTPEVYNKEYCIEQCKSIIKQLENPDTVNNHNNEDLEWNNKK